MKEAIDNWYSEVSSYNFSQPLLTMGKGQFTQIVWEASTELGIGIAVAERGPDLCFYLVANYSPAGNNKYRFIDNVFEA